MDLRYNLIILIKIAIEHWMALVKYLVKLFLKLNALNKYLFFFKFFRKGFWMCILDYNIIIRL